MSSLLVRFVTDVALTLGRFYRCHTRAGSPYVALKSVGYVTTSKHLSIGTPGGSGDRHRCCLVSLLVANLKRISDPFSVRVLAVWLG